MDLTNFNIHFLPDAALNYEASSGAGVACDPAVLGTGCYPLLNVGAVHA